MIVDMQDGQLQPRASWKAAAVTAVTGGERQDTGDRNKQGPQQRAGGATGGAMTREVSRLPHCVLGVFLVKAGAHNYGPEVTIRKEAVPPQIRSEEHTSELQSREN